MSKYLLILFLPMMIWADDLLIPMDFEQSDHLKAYGLIYWAITNEAKVDWLINYRGGSFRVEGYEKVVEEALVRGVTVEMISSTQYAQILQEIAQNNMDVVPLEKAPKVAVYTPPGKYPWDDAVTMALTYAEIPYTPLWDEEVLRGDLSKYDWLHLHHEDFTGQYGKFYATYQSAPWYIEQKARFENIARANGFNKVSQLKLASSLKIKQFMLDGGFLFAMCSATDSYDIALSAQNTDICGEMFDGDPLDNSCQQKLNYTHSIAFTDFKLELSPYVYEYSNIDMTEDKVKSGQNEQNDYFQIFDFSAKYDPIPAILTQNHTRLIKGFMGQTTSYRRELIKKSAIILGDIPNSNEVRYLHGAVGKGFFTFLGGHDPEDYQHLVGDPPTELSLHKNSPGYRLILNNILFPATSKKKQKT